MREALVELDAEKEELSGTWVNDVVGREMSLEPDLMNGVDDSLCTLQSLVLVWGASLQVLQCLSFAVVRPNEGCKDEPVP